MPISSTVPHPVLTSLHHGLQRLIARLRAGVVQLGGWVAQLAPQPKPRVAPLTPAQTGLVIGHFLLLGRQDREARFNGTMGFEALCRRYHSADWGRTRFLGLWVGGRLVGLAELAETDLYGAPACEIGISLRGPWQHQGLAHQLFEAAVQQVVANERLPLVLFTRATNAPMVQLARRFGGQGKLEDGEYRFVFAPAPRDGRGAIS